MIEYLTNLLSFAGRPSTHIAIIWAIWILSQIRYQGKRLRRLEAALGIIATPMPMPKVGFPLPPGVTDDPNRPNTERRGEPE